MAKRAAHFDEAERLYVQENCGYTDIAGKLGLSEKTVRTWSAEGLWENKRAEFLRSRRQFHSDLYDFARELMESIRRDVKNGVEVSPGRMYAFTKTLPQILRVHDYEKKVAEENKGDQTVFTAKDIIAIVNQEIHGGEQT